MLTVHGSLLRPLHPEYYVDAAESEAASSSGSSGGGNATGGDGNGTGLSAVAWRDASASHPLQTRAAPLCRFGAPQPPGSRFPPPFLSTVAPPRTQWLARVRLTTHAPRAPRATVPAEWNGTDVAFCRSPPWARRLWPREPVTPLGSSPRPHLVADGASAGASADPRLPCADAFFR